jgi:hypothetical protein
LRVRGRFWSAAPAVGGLCCGCARHERVRVWVRENARARVRLCLFAINAAALLRARLRLQGSEWCRSEKMADDNNKLAAIMAKRKERRAAAAATSDASGVGSGGSTPVPSHSRQSSYHGQHTPNRPKFLACVNTDRESRMGDVCVLARSSFCV